MNSRNINWRQRCWPMLYCSLSLLQSARVSAVLPEPTGLDNIKVAIRGVLVVDKPADTNREASFLEIPFGIIRQISFCKLAWGASGIITHIVTKMWLPGWSRCSWVWPCSPKSWEWDISPSWCECDSWASWDDERLLINCTFILDMSSGFAQRFSVNAGIKAIM